MPGTRVLAMESAPETTIAAGGETQARAEALICRLWVSRPSSGGAMVQP